MSEVRAPGGVLLVSCYELGRQPQQLALAAAGLERAGFRPRLLDLSLDRLDQAAVAGAALIVVSVPMHTALRMGIALLPRLRALAPQARVAFQGLYAPMNEALLCAAGADVVVGEHEAWLVELAEALADQRPPPAPPTHARPRIDLAPARGGLPEPRRYGALLVARDDAQDPERRIAGTLEASRGCLHLCRHCPVPPVWNGRFVAVAQELVIEDARRQLAAGVRHFSFADPDFLNGPGHALAVARALHAQAPGLSFDFTAKVEHLLRRRGDLPELAALGCVFVVSAVESLSDRVLAILDKGHTRADIVTALGLVRAAGMSLRPTFVAFTPWTTIEDYLELCAFIRAHHLDDEVDPIQLAIRLLLPPGSLLLARPELGPHLGALDEGALAYRWSHPDPRMDRLATEVMAICERAAAAAEDPGRTFVEIHTCAARIAGIQVPERSAEAGRRRTAPPRLSEAWFCCAEPTTLQLRSTGGDHT